MSDDTVCGHLDTITEAVPHATGCEDCLRIGGQWVHLRRCLACGHIGCCDSSPNTHATAHHRSSDHPLIQSFEPGEDWIWCFPDEIAFELPSMLDSPSHP
jgi:uncharacterized UBP type Zn finger protein